MVVCRTSDGDIAFLANHAPLIGSLGIGPVRIYSGDTAIERAAVHGGFVEVSNDTVTILSDVAELASQIDVERARAAMGKADERVKQNHDTEAEAAARRAHVRLSAAGGLAAASH
jgi:F-type H+-transporting ATPase subunit epsilon